MITFTTVELSKGVLIKLTFNDIVSNLDIVKSLERIIRISPLRIKVLTSTFDLEKIRNSANRFKNAPEYVYEVVIAPDPTNDTTSPSSIVTSFLSNNTRKNLFKEDLPQWADTATVQYYELRSVKPRITILPYPTVINLYNATFNLKYWERANIYATIVKQPEKSEDSIDITQKQISALRVSELSASEK